MSVHLSSVHVDSAEPAYRERIRAGTHELWSDEPEVVGGGDTGASPYALVLAGLGSCTASTLRMYASRKGWELGPVGVDLHFFRDGEEEHIERTLRLAPSVTAEQRARLAEIAEKTPVTKTIKRGTKIVTRIAE